MSERTGLEVAVIGLAGRFPGAKSIEELWRNLAGGVESIVRFTDEELAAAGVPQEVLEDPHYVKAGAVLEDVELIDAEFFGLTPREAEIIDPQHRLFLECAWEALESAGYDPETCGDTTGVYAGVSLSTYTLLNVWSHGGRFESLGGLLGADKDHLTTLVSWKLNLGGPSLAVQTACSTSLVAVHLAAQALLNGECDTALAGGASIRFPQRSGYRWTEGGILSADGHCRAFDAEAQGTVFGSGVGVVVLKRLEDALAVGDVIHAVIKGSAINNDGARRVGYTAPSLEGQARVIRAAQLMAEVEPGTLGYVEAHGTGTALGDSIEVSALTEAFRAGTERTKFCALGSVKTNVGHLNAAAGVAGLIKAVLALEHRMIPPTPHFRRPNPRIDFASSPFFVNAEPLAWDGGEELRRAAVHSFGMGGTNAHVILEEAPQPVPTTPSRPLQLLVLSGQSSAALEAATERLATHLDSYQDEDLADVAYTLHLGRRGFAYRRAALAASREEAARALTTRDPQRVLTAAGGDRERPVWFLFPGQGTQYVNMARGLYEAEPGFREEVNRCTELLLPRLGFDLRELLYPSPERAAAAAERLRRTAVAEPALFVVEHSLAKLWMEWGVRPRGMLGHGIGEYAAACVAGVFRLEDALALTTLRGRLLEELEDRSATMDSVLATLAEAVRQCGPKAPSLPFVSSISGRWITAGEAADPAYWTRQLQQTVRLADCLERLTATAPDGVLLEVGPGRSLTTMARKHPAVEGVLALTSVGIPQESEPDQEVLLRTLGQLWLAGSPVDWRAFYAYERRRRVALPTYPFERRRYWVEPRSAVASSRAEDAVRMGTVEAAREAAGAHHPRPSLRTAYAPPRTETERTIAAVWQDLFGIAEIGVDDDFFDLGGHSLLVTRMASRVREALGVELPLRTFFEERSVARLAAVAKHEPGARRAAPPLERVPRQGDLPLSFGQQRLWFLSRLDPDSPAYNLSVALRLAGELDVTALASALDEIVRRHEVLRTTFATDSREPIQVIHPPRFAGLPMVDLAGLPAMEREAQRLVLEDPRRPFDLGHGPLLRTTVVRLKQNEHILLFAMHHIVSDGWSLGVLVREVGSLYRTFALGEPPSLPELPIQYADYAVWQRSWLQGEVLTEHVAYWRERLAGAPALLRLPTDRPRPAVQRFQGARFEARLPQELDSALRAAGQRHGATLFVALLAAFAVLLRRHSGQDDLVVGTPTANRDRHELEGLIGFFVNTLVLRADLTGDPTFEDFLPRVRETALGAYAHQGLPFEKLVDELQPERSLSHSPLFQVMLALQNLPPAALELPGLSLRAEERPHEVSKFDLTLTVNEMPTGLFCRWRYNSELFDPATVERLAGHLRILAEGAAENPGRRLSELPLLAEAERQQLLVNWSRGESADSGSRCLHELVEQQAARRPESPAVVFAGGELGYADLNRRANRLARRLRRLGVGPEVPVGVCAERSPATVVGLLAVLKAGGAYVPLDPAYPRERLAWLLADAGVPVLLTQGPLLRDLPPHAAQVVVLEEELAESEEDLLTPVEATNLAYVIYTSGSTGRPKGVLVSHRGLENLAQAQTRLFEVGPDSRVLQFASLSFDASVSEMAMAFYAGAALCLAPRRDLLPGPELSELLRRQGITTVTLPPTALATLAEEALPDLRTIIVAGEVCPVDLARRWAPRRLLVNAYGPTEATVCATATVYDGGERLPVGRPIKNVEVYVLEEAGHPAPVGVAGELLVGGLGLARGYRGRPELTAERFVPHPFSSSPGERLYRTGDLVRFLPGGDLEFLGRIDHQVKIRGVRVEPGEVESALLAQPGVREAVAVGRQDGSGPARLVAYVVPEAGGGLDPTVLRSALAGSLPEPLVPAAVVVLEALPLTPNGKVDRKALPAPAGGRSGGREFVAPRTDLERFLAGLWQEILGTGRVGIYDDFFALGGNSITGAMFVNRLQRELGEIVHVVVMFDAPTVAQLAAWVVANYPEAVVRIFGPDALGEARKEAWTARIDDARVAEFRALIPPLAPIGGPLVKNPPAAFILSPPRCGSTLLRVMLGGNPRLFAPPELELLSFNTLAERHAAFPGRNSFWLEGVIRGVMEVRGCAAEEAEALLEEMEREGATSGELYRRLQEWIGDRLLIDKTPSYALDLAVLRRAEELFSEARYVHLLRHPFGMIRSFEEAKLEQVFFRHSHRLSRRELAELIWLVSQQNIVEFLSQVPAERQTQVRFEELLAEPEAVLRGLCDFLGVEYHPDMAEPYQGKSARMTDGVHAWSRMLGDVKFHQHAGIDASVAERWREQYEQDFLGEPARDLAERLGYQLGPAEGGKSTNPAPPLVRIPREGSLPLSFGQQRLWFLNRLDPESPTYNIPLAVRLLGRLRVQGLEQALDEIVCRHEVLRTTFRTEGSEPVQEIHPPRRFRLAIVDLGRLPEADRERQARRLATDEAGRPFELDRGPLLRALMLRLADEEHVLLLTMHHIVSDGWSMGVLVHELTAVYEAFATGQPCRLPELPIQYADFACWQRAWLSGRVLEEQLAYWKERLANAPGLLELPTDRPRPAVQRFRGGRQRKSLSPGLVRRLEVLGSERRATLFMSLLAVFSALLRRYSGQEDLVIGSPIAGRPRVETESLIGFFPNTLALRTDLPGDPSCQELLDRARDVALEAYAYQDLPFEKLIDELNLPRDLSRTPLFQVLLVLQNAPMGRVDLSGLTLLPLGGVEGSTAKFDLSVSFTEIRDGLAGNWTYNADLFDPATVARLCGHFGELLERMAAAPRRPLSDLPLLSDPERQQLLEWNATGATYPRARGLHELIEAQAARTPDAVAVVYEGSSLTYAELDARAERVASVLRDLGVGTEVRVGICVERSLEMMIGLLGILKAGGAYVPLDPLYPVERLAFMLEGSRFGLESPVLLTQRRLLGKLAAREGRVVCLDDAFPDARLADRAEAVQPDQLAYVIYTSGSTGTPKGAMNTHRAIVNRLLWMQETFGLTPDDRVVQKTPFSFDVSVWELFWPLLIGARLVIARPGGHQDPGYLTRLIGEQGVTTVHFVPSMLQVFLDAPGLRGCSSLRRVIASGEALPADLERRFFSRLGWTGTDLHNLYGPTEAAVDVTFWACERQSRRFSVPIGRPVANNRIHLLGRHQCPVPIGVPGELHIGGVQVGRGYLNRPALTAEKFVPDFLGSEPGARLYATGDLARYLPDGAIEFLGRIDHQVKVRGFRIELEEIGAVLVEHPAVREAVVVAREGAAGNGMGDRRLVAYVVPEKGGEIRPAELRAFLTGSLPDYMLPTGWVVLEAMPLTPSGKVDRRALPPQSEPLEPRGVQVAPRNELERFLASLWQDLLGVESVGVGDDFFALGGNSIIGAVLTNRLQERLREIVPVVVLFEAPTVEKLAARLAHEHASAIARLFDDICGEMPERLGFSGEQPEAWTAIEPATVEPGQPWPLSFAQERLWVLDRMDPGSPAYNIPSAVRLIGRLEIDALARSLTEIVRRHAVLRSLFVQVEGEPAQIVAAPAPVPLPQVDLEVLPAGEREAEARRLAREFGRQPFELERGPMLRAALLRFGEEDHAALFALHHIASDGWSMAVLVREVSVLYAAFREGRLSPLPELPIQYLDYARWQREWLTGEVLERELAHWREALAGIEPMQLPTDRPHPPFQTFHGATRSFAVSGDTAAGLTALGQRQGGTPFMVLLAAFSALLSRYSGQEDIAIGSPTANRTRHQLEHLIGFFVNTVVLRADLSQAPSFERLLGRVRHAAVAAFGHQELPFEKVVFELQPERDLSRSPLFQVMFTLHNTPAEALVLPGLELRPFSPGIGTAKFDLSLSMVERPDGFTGSLEYNTDLFDRSTMDRLACHFQSLLEQVIAEPTRSVVDLPLLSPVEHHQLAVEWSDSAAPCSHGVCVHELIKRQVERTPEAVAVSFQGRRLTYRELDLHAERLAARLAAVGVGPETRVGVCLERTPEMVVALLAAWKAGAAYIPMDPSYPEERLAYMLEDAGIVLLLADQATPVGLAERADVVVRVDRDAEEEATLAPLALGDPAQLAYVIYTSGSTGRPKGVEVSHGALVNFLGSMGERPGLGPDDVLLAVTSLSFDIAALELFLPLVAGARVEIASRQAAADGDRLLRLLASSGATAMQATPVTWRLLIEAGWRGDDGLAVLCGGEALPERLAAELYSRSDSVWNLYGPTETTVWSAARRIRSGERVAVGPPIANTGLHLLDTGLQPVPVGVPGELWIGGQGLARGYRNRPELTAERFVPDPFSSFPGARIYRTGDLARFRPDGAIEFLGRVDHQVKIRGFRIELGEIEAALESCPGVEQAVVMARGEEGGRRLVAYLVPRGGDASPLSVTELRESLVRDLPDYMVPSAWMLLDTLPLTPNGKVDRRALPAAEGRRPDLAGGYIAPRTALEQVLAGIWRDVLRVERVGLQDNFFVLGGHSLLATRVVSRIGEALEIEVPLRRLFEAPTVSGLAESLLRDSSSRQDLEQAAELVLDLLRLSEEEVDALLLGYVATADTMEGTS